MERRTLYLMPPQFLTTDGREFAIVEQDQIVSRVPLGEIQQVVAFAGCDFSPLAVRTAKRYDIPLIFLADHGETISRLEPPEKAIYFAQQCRCLNDPDFCLQLAQALLRGRLHNEIAVLSQGGDAHDPQPAIAQRQAGLETLPTLPDLTAVRAWARSIPTVDRTPWQFLGSQWRAFNLQLAQGDRLATALLSQELYALLRQAGCSPHLGTLHPDCQNHLPLPCDLMEQFRPLLTPWVWQHSTPIHPYCSLAQWQQFLQTFYSHPYGGVMTLRDCLAWQVEEYVMALTEGTAYRPFLWVA